MCIKNLNVELLYVVGNLILELPFQFVVTVHVPRWQWWSCKVCSSVHHTDLCSPNTNTNSVHPSHWTPNSALLHSNTTAYNMPTDSFVPRFWKILDYSRNSLIQSVVIPVIICVFDRQTVQFKSTVDCFKGNFNILATCSKTYNLIPTPRKFQTLAFLEVYTVLC